MIKFMIVQLTLPWLTLKLEEVTSSCVTAFLKLPSLDSENVLPPATAYAGLKENTAWDSSSKTSSFQLNTLFSPMGAFSVHGQEKRQWICKTSLFEDSLLFPSLSPHSEGFMNCRKDSFPCQSSVWQCYILRFVRNTSLFWKQCEGIFWCLVIFFTSQPSSSKRIKQVNRKSVFL